MFLRNFFLFLIIFSFSFSFTFAHEEDERAILIKISENGFSPEEIFIKTGDTVIFENVGEEDHWPASDIHPTHGIYPEFDPKGGILPGEEWEFTFNKPGEWRMHDHLWPQFVGKITVEGEEIEEKVSIGNKFSNFIFKIKSFFGKIYFKIFPGKIEKDFTNVSVFEISEDEKELLFWLERLGSEKVMTKLLDESGGGYDIDCHQPAHQVGRMAFALFGKEAFKDGDASCHSGYYHGAMEEFIRESGTKNLASNISALCNSFETHFGVFECFHGVGHGVMAYDNYDLLEAIEDCNSLANSFESRSCYGGVFMENVVAGQGLGAIPGHETEWVSFDDPHFPCNALESDFSVLYECYQMQTSWMLYINSYDFDKVADICDSTREDMIPVCYKSFGRDVAGHFLRDKNKIIEYCGKVSREDGGENYNKCIEGAVNVIIDFWGPALKGQADEVCFLLEGGSQSRCSSLVSSRKTQLFSQ